MAICRWTDEETDDHVTGSGADQWEWYRTSITGNESGYAVMMYDGMSTDPDDAKRFTFTRGKVRSVVTEIMMGKHNISDEYVRYFKNDDPDACAMDCAIQIIVYGEVVYG